jgi:hypothetical protein
MRRPTRIRYRATISLPANPTTAATATAHRWVTSRGDQPVDGLPGRERAGQGDHGDDEQAAQVLRPAVSVGVPLGGRAAGERVPQQGHRPRQHHDDGLDRRSDRQDEHAQQERPPPVGVRLQRLVHLVGAVVGVRAENLRDAVPAPTLPDAIYICEPANVSQ